MKNHVDYNILSAQLKALAEDVPYEIANLSNAAALLWEVLPDINWAGFYKMVDGILVLYPFQGKPACIRIPVGRGVCGTAVAEDKTQLVYDVHKLCFQFRDCGSHPREWSNLGRSGYRQSLHRPLY